MDGRLSALLEAREAEGSLARALFTPDDEPASESAEEKAGVQPEQTKPAEDSVLPVPVKTSSKAAEGAGKTPDVPLSGAPVTRVKTVPLIRPEPAASVTGTAAAASTAAVIATAGGTAAGTGAAACRGGPEYVAGRNERGWRN